MPIPAVTPLVVRVLSQLMVSYGGMSRPASTGHQKGRLKLATKGTAYPFSPTMPHRTKATLPMVNNTTKGSVASSPIRKHPGRGPKWNVSPLTHHLANFQFFNPI